MSLSHRASVRGQEDSSLGTLRAQWSSDLQAAAPTSSPQNGYRMLTALKNSCAGGFSGNFR